MNAEYANQMTTEQAMKSAEELRRKAEISGLNDEINRLRRRIADLEDFLRGAATQFLGMAGR